MKTKKHIAFLSGTRADFGKIKSLIQILENTEHFVPHIFVTGMHLQHEYGYTLIEIERSGFKNIHTFSNHTNEMTMDLTLAKTIQGFSNFIKNVKPDLIVIHGDRVEALAGAIVGSLNNILVAHIEGGEVSGTIDELIRHSTSKMSHIHFVANELAQKRLIQMGELKESIKIIGSPDIDIMFSNHLPSLKEAKSYYDITFEKFAVAMFHPVTTEHAQMKTHAKHFVDALLASDENVIVIYPNNDLGSKDILLEYKRLENNLRFRVFPSLRFEYFLVLLEHSKFIIGNSSAGIREAPLYGIPTINIGSRQENRAVHSHIVNTAYDAEHILNAIKNLPKNIELSKYDFGSGNSAQQFLEALNSEALWTINHQKQFVDIQS
ncbi:MAG: UDP-N-acetylglucosamine 2-epimerase [Psychroserpens sp.]